MTEFSIKINKSPQNEMPAPNRPAPEQKRPGISAVKKRPWLIYCLLALAVIEAAAVAFLVITEKTPAFYELLPENPAAVVYINKTPLKELLSGLNQDNYAWPPFTLIKDSVLNLTGQNNLNLNELTDLVQEKMAFILFPGNSAQPRWLLIASPATGSEKLNEAIEKAKKDLSANLNVIVEPYRQIKIVQIQSLKDDKKIIFLATVNSYLLFTNNLDVLKQTIDKILR